MEGRGSINVLFRDPVQRRVIVEAKVTGMDDVVGTSLLREFVEGPKVACASSSQLQIPEGFGGTSGAVS